jgi:hypothetical protein
VAPRTPIHFSMEPCGEQLGHWVTEN